jgi:hypothetical protein
LKFFDNPEKVYALLRGYGKILRLIESGAKLKSAITDIAV